MSLILDALKKSERERQRDKAPGLQSIHQPPPRFEARSHRHWWWMAALAMVILNAALLAYWRFQQPVVAGSSALPSSAVKTAGPATASPISTEVKTVVPSNSSAAVNSTADEYTQMVPAQAGVASAPTKNDLRIEEVGELADDVRNNLPAMTFSFHVYSANSQQRTIIINNRRMREGDEVSAGLQLQEITEDGVILLYAGHRVHIGVLSGW